MVEGNKILNQKKDKHFCVIQDWRHFGKSSVQGNIQPSLEPLSMVELSPWILNFTWRRMQHKQPPVQPHNSIQVKMAQGHGVSSHHLMQLSTNKWSSLMLQVPPGEFDTLNTVIQFNTASEHKFFESSFKWKWAHFTCKHSKIR